MDFFTNPFMLGWGTRRQRSGKTGYLFSLKNHDWFVKLKKIGTKSPFSDRKKYVCIVIFLSHLHLQYSDDNLFTKWKEKNKWK